MGDLEQRNGQKEQIAFILKKYSLFQTSQVIFSALEITLGDSLFKLLFKFD